MRADKPLRRAFPLLLVLLAAAALLIGARVLRRAPAEALSAFDEAEMTRAIDAAWRAGEKELLLRYAPGEPGVEAVEARAETYLALLAAQSPRYRYTVRESSCAVTEEERAVELRLRFWYQAQDLSYDELPKAASVGEALTLFEPALRRGETVFTFLAEGDWPTEELNLLSSALLANSAELAAETNLYRYEVVRGTLEPCAYVSIEAEYPVEHALLDERTRELRAALDALAAEIKAQGGDERALYLAAARAVMLRADYDGALGRVADTEELSEEQRVARSAYGALVSGQTVCTGYAMAFKALCDRLDLPCRVVSGRNGGEHAWNLIRPDGEALFADCSFADVLGDESYCFMDGETLVARGYVLSDEALVFP